MRTIEEGTDRREREADENNQGAGEAFRQYERRVRHVRDDLVDGVERRMHEVKRAVRHGRNTLEDGVDELEHRVRRNPSAALGIALVAGGIVGFLAGVLVRRRASSD